MADKHSKAYHSFVISKGDQATKDRGILRFVRDLRSAAVKDDEGKLIVGSKTAAPLLGLTETEVNELRAKSREVLTRHGKDPDQYLPTAKRGRTATEKTAVLADDEFLSILA